MIFEEVCIHNLFCYYDKVLFDLKVTDQARNLVLIHGRNGYGKTSFINSVKLLFGGANATMRDSVQAGRRMNERDYILGRSDEWLGIMNRRARQEGQRDFGVSIKWTEQEGHVKAERKWRLQNGSFENELTVMASFLNEILNKEDAQGFIDKRIPQDYIPFFFFDGEQIQAIAEANRKTQIEQIEKLLNITQIETLYEYIGNVSTQWKKDAMDSTAKAELNRLENELNILIRDEAGYRDKIDELNYEISKLEREIADEDRYLESMRAYKFQRDEAFLKEEKSRLKDYIQNLQYKVAETLSIDIPLLANTALVKKSVEHLRKLSESQAEAQIQLIQTFIDELPRSVFDNPPFSNSPLTEGQKAFYKKRLFHYLEAHLAEPEHIAEGPFYLDMKKAQALLEIMSSYLHAEQLRTQRANELKELSDKKRELEEIERKLNDISNLSEEERQIYQQKKNANDERQRQLGEKRRELKDENDKAGKIPTEIRKKQEEMKKQVDLVQASAKAKRKLEIARNLQNLFWSYKDALKKHRRQAIQDAINQHFQHLMSAHHLIDRIEVKDDFGLHYMDKEGNSIGMANISSGMKQLIATALLWTLNEVSGKRVPLVIDTPLARIDREHQNNLLTFYYPKAGEQIIVLPTDSELDQEKYNLIAPYIYRQYALENRDGEMAKVIERPMY